MDEGYIFLINSIIYQAIKDYKWSVWKLGREPDNIMAHWMKADVIRFLRSDWFEMMTDIDGEWLLKKLEKEIE